MIKPTETGKFLPVTVEGAKSMAHLARYPDDLGKKLTPATFSKVVTELLARLGNYTLLMRDNEVVALAKAGDHHALDAERVLRTIDQVGQADYHRVHIDGQTARLEIVGTQEQAVARGDMVRAGSMVQFSPIGSIAPSVQSFVMQLVCTNGAVTMDVVREYNYGGGDNGGNNGGVWNWFKESIRDSRGALTGTVAQWRRMREERVPPGDRAGMLQAMLRQAHIAGPAAEAVRAQALENPPRSAYDMHNLITWASSHVLTDPVEVRRAQIAAAAFSSETTHAHLCPTCRRTR